MIGAWVITCCTMLYGLLPTTHHETVDSLHRCVSADSMNVVHQMCVRAIWNVLCAAVYLPM